jgi:hypothetical protein
VSVCVIPPLAGVPREWMGFRGFLASDFRPRLFWMKHCQLVMGLCLAGSFVFFDDGKPASQWIRLAINLTVVGAFYLLIVSVGRFGSRGWSTALCVWRGGVGGCVCVGGGGLGSGRG